MSGYRVLQDPDMLALYERAERERLWFHCSYQDLWFSPVELRAAQESGRFCWGPVNWELRTPEEYLLQAEQERDSKIQAVRDIQARIAKYTRRAG